MIRGTAVPKKLNNALFFSGAFNKIIHHISDQLRTFKFKQPNWSNLSHSKLNWSNISWSKFLTFLHANINAFVFLLLALAFAVINAFYVFWSFEQVESSVASRQHSQQTIQLANQLITNITLAQTDLRGYVLTNQPDLLKPYTDAVRNAKQQLNLLQSSQLPKSDQAYLEKLSTLIFTQLRNMVNVVALQSTNNRAAMDYLNKDENKQLITAINLGHQQFIASQVALLNRNEAKFQATMRHFYKIITLNGVMILFFALTFAYFFYRQSKQKVKNTIYVKTQKLLVTQQDMTHKLTLANKVLEDNEAKLALTLNSMGHAVIATDLFARITRINTVAEQLTGWTFPEAIARPIDEVCHFINASTLEPVASTVFETMAQATTQALPENTLLVSRNGDNYYVADTCAPIFNAHNTVQGAVLVFRDVTEQTLTHQKLQVSEELYRATFDHSSVGIAHVAPNGQFLRVNKCFTEFTQFSEDELLQQNFQNITHPADLDKVVDLCDQLLLGEIKRFNIEKRYLRKDKSVVWVEAAVSCMHKPNGDVDYMITVMENITEKKQATTDSRQFFTLSQELLCVAGLDGYFKQLNETWHKVLGYTAEEMLATPYLDFVHEEDIEKTKIAMSKLQHASAMPAFENRYKCKNGSVRHLLWSVAVDHDAKLLYASARDITERKQYETDLVLRANQFNTLLEEAPVGIFLVDKNLRFLHYNTLALDGFIRKSNLSGVELITLLIENVGNKRASEALKIFENTLLTGEPYYIQEYEESSLAEGTRYWSWQINRITLPEGDHGVVCYFQNITERVLNQQKVVENEARFRALFDHGPVAMYFCDIDGKIQLYNRVAADIWQIEPSTEQNEADFRANFKFYELDNIEIPYIDTCVKKVLTGIYDSVHNKEIILERDDGSRVNLIKNVVPIKNSSDKIIGAVSCFFDITYRRQTEVALLNYTLELKEAKAAAEKANAAKSEFLSSMSHELRTPLNAILGFAQLMQSATPAVTQTPTPMQLRNINQILDAGWYLLELINEILDLAQIESGKQPLFLEPVLLNNVMRDCAMLIEPLAQKNSITVEFAPMPAYTYVHADKIRLKQIIINLLSNAIKYNKKGGLVSVDCTHKKGIAKINVRDTGIGLNADQLDHLFEPFNRLGQEAHAEEGTGIGLMVSKKLVELMQGNIGAQSLVNEGSVFWISLNLIDQIGRAHV